MSRRGAVRWAIAAVGWIIASGAALRFSWSEAGQVGTICVTLAALGTLVVV